RPLGGEWQNMHGGGFSVGFHNTSQTWEVYVPALESLDAWDTGLKDEATIAEDYSEPLSLWFDPDDTPFNRPGGKHSFPELNLSMNGSWSIPGFDEQISYVLLKDGEAAAIDSGTFSASEDAHPISLSDLSGEDAGFYAIGAGFDYNADGSLDASEASFLLPFDLIVYAHRLNRALDVAMQTPPVPSVKTDATAEQYVLDTVDNMESKWSEYIWWQEFNFDSFITEVDAALSWSSFSASWDDDGPLWYNILNDMGIPNGGANAGELMHEVTHVRNDFRNQFDGVSEDEGLGYVTQYLVNSFLPRLSGLEDKFNGIIEIESASERRMALFNFTEDWSSVWNRFMTVVINGNVSTDNDPTDFERTVTGSDILNFEQAYGVDLSIAKMVTALNNKYETAHPSSDVDFAFSRLHRDNNSEISISPPLGVTFLTSHLDDGYLISEVLF
ncbi:MAG: hypothetical protein AAF328_07315, partial [Planctomycetota bacterium]